MPIRDWTLYACGHCGGAELREALSPCPFRGELICSACSVTAHQVYDHCPPIGRAKRRKVATA